MNKVRIIDTELTEIDSSLVYVFNFYEGVTRQFIVEIINLKIRNSVMRSAFNLKWNGILQISNSSFVNNTGTFIKSLPLSQEVTSIQMTIAIENSKFQEINGGQDGILIL